MSEPSVTLGLVSNIWSKQMVFSKAGDIEHGHAHCFDHLTLLAHGELLVGANNKVTKFIAPTMIWIAAGVEHTLTAAKDNTIAYCIHALRDGDGVDDIISPDMIPEGTNASTIFNYAKPLIDLEGQKNVPEHFLDPRAK